MRVFDAVCRTGQVEISVCHCVCQARSYTASTEDSIEHRRGTTGVQITETLSKRPPASSGLKPCYKHFSPCSTSGKRDRGLCNAELSLASMRTW